MPPLQHTPNQNYARYYLLLLPSFPAGTCCLPKDRVLRRSRPSPAAPPEAAGCPTQTAAATTPGRPGTAQHLSGAAFDSGRLTLRPDCPDAVRSPPASATVPKAACRRSRQTSAAAAPGPPALPPQKPHAAAKGLIPPSGPRSRLSRLTLGAKKGRMLRPFFVP